VAGNYPDVPSWRMAYDKDGTQVFEVDLSNNVTALTTTQARSLNDENNLTWKSSVNQGYGYLVFIFPELRDLDGIFLAATTLGDTTRTVQATVWVSPDSTNGVDGTWEELVSAYTAPVQTQPNYRSQIQSTTALQIKAVKIGANGPWGPDFRSVHLYGEIAPNQNPNRLALWHPSLNQRVSAAWFDWGNTPRSSSADRQFRVKNLSSTLTAQAPRIAMDALTDTSPSVPGQHLLSLDATNFGAQQTLPDLAPGAISLPVTFRRVTPTNAVLSLWAFRLYCEAGSWV